MNVVRILGWGRGQGTDISSFHDILATRLFKSPNQKEPCRRSRAPFGCIHKPGLKHFAKKSLSPFMLGVAE